MSMDVRTRTTTRPTTPARVPAGTPAQDSGRVELDRRTLSWRRVVNWLATVLVAAAFVLAILPLAAVLSFVVYRGADSMTPEFFLTSMRGIGPFDPEGGIYHGLVGTLEQVGLASLMAVPLGLLTAIYLVEYGRGALAKTVNFFVDVMIGVPSIVAGLFVLAFWVIVLGRGFSGFAGALALAILMLPIVTRSAQQMLALVPNELREASLALGVPRWKTILRVVLPTALGGVVTGVLLAVARVVGETAPVLLVVFGTDNINVNPFAGPQSSLPLIVFAQNGKGNEFAVERAWGAALALIVLVLLLSLAARLVTWWSGEPRRRARRRGRRASARVPRAATVTQRIKDHT